MNSLDATLASLTPQEADARLSAMWRNLAQHKDWPAVESILDRQIHRHEAFLFDPLATDTARAFHAGATDSLRSLRAAIGLSLSFDPTTAEYPTQASEEIPLGLDPTY